MRKFKVQFIKDQKGQKYYERSLSMEGLEILLVLCDTVQVVKTNRKTGKVTFIFNKAEMSTYCSCKKLPLWILKKFLPEKEWIDDFARNKEVQRKNGRANVLRANGRSESDSRPVAVPG